MSADALESHVSAPVGLGASGGVRASRALAASCLAALNEVSLSVLRHPEGNGRTTRGPGRGTR